MVSSLMDSVWVSLAWPGLTVKQKTKLCGVMIQIILKSHCKVPKVTTLITFGFSSLFLYIVATFG